MLKAAVTYPASNLSTRNKSEIQCIAENALAAAKVIEIDLVWCSDCTLTEDRHVCELQDCTDIGRDCACAPSPIIFQEYLSVALYAYLFGSRRLSIVYKDKLRQLQ